MDDIAISTSVNLCDEHVASDYIVNAKTTAGKRRIPFGMSSFNKEEQRKFGENVKLCMAFVDGTTKAPLTPDKAIPNDAVSIAKRLKFIGKDISCAQADQLELLVRLDDLKGWESSGARHCAAWMNMELGISHSLGWEYLRVGRKLRTLPIATALFRAGQLTWSKIRLLTRIANDDNEAGLCHAALDASVSQLERLCEEYRSPDDDSSGSDNDRSMRQWAERSLSWAKANNGNTTIRLSLPPENAQAFLNSVEQSLSLIERSDDTVTQRRADAAVLMAETSIQAAGREIATADRYQVIVTVDASDLQTQDQSGQSENPENEKSAENPQCETQKNTMPYKRPGIAGTGSIARESARRIACDCSLSAILSAEGEPVSIGRKTRVWPAAMSRAIKVRDSHCQFPGCTQTRHLEIHHIEHWADGGSTSIDNGVSICTGHHRFLHEGGYRIERVDNNPQHLAEQFDQQRHEDDLSAIEVERLLRNSRASFDHVRALSPDCYRFRVVDCAGRDIRDIRNMSADVNFAHTDVRHAEGCCANPDNDHRKNSHSDNSLGSAEHNATQGQSNSMNRHSVSTHATHDSTCVDTSPQKSSTSCQVAESAAPYIIKGILRTYGRETIHWRCL